MRIDRLRKNYEIEIKWTAFPLHPDTPEEGRTLEELFKVGSEEIRKKMLHLRQVADELGLPLGQRTKTYNSRLAQELAKWAEAKGRGDEFHEAVFRAYFVDGKNIATMEELVTLAEFVGLPAEEARTVLQTRSYRQPVDADWFRARLLGVTAVPTFVIDRRAVVGAQPLGVLAQLLIDSNVKKRDHVEPGHPRQ